jgi:molybdenum transport protein
MIYFTDKEIDELLAEDVPYFDITTSILRLENKPAKIQISTKENTVVCCTEEVLKIFSKLSIQPTLFTGSGEFIEKGVKFLEGEGLSKNIHASWRTCENILGFASGIATRTRELVEKAKESNPDIQILTTRQTIPYTKKIAIKAVMAGGGSIHRLGLSESILIFDNHYSFLGDFENLEARINEQKSLIADKNITIEVKNSDDALKVARTNVNIIILNRFEVTKIKELKKEINKLNPGIRLAVSGGITGSNVTEYAKSGADMLISSWPYYADPSDLSVTITPIFDY